MLADGSFTYTPDNGFVGTETLTYTVTDGTETVSGQLVITVGNTAPEAVADAYSVHARITSYNVCYTKLLRGGGSQENR